MFARQDLNKVFIISELHPQFSGDLATLQTMILQSKLGGADAVKLQLYDTQNLHGNDLRKYLEISKTELTDIKKYADSIGIELFASVFDTERIEWCESLGFKRYKIAGRSVKDKELSNAIISTGKPVYISLGMYDWTEGFPYENENITYFYCVSKYPAFLEDIQMPLFKKTSALKGYSDHTPGIAACIYAVSRGAMYIEKHFTLDKGRQFSTEKAHLCSMNLDELRELRKLVDGISILRNHSVES
ncbi:N-acetylneuraminate synthase [Candidatus Magnetomorum sp. HK-1]|nr:N-acetylneuraminate synthase [Candidatus Magnetomorum sp. HK-1]